MRFNINTRNLRRAVDAVMPAAAVRSPLDSLKGVLAEVKGNQLTLTASDMDITISKTVECDGMQDGKVTIPQAPLLRDITKRLPGVETTFDLVETKLKVNSEAVSYDLTTIPAEEFPSSSVSTIIGETEMESALFLAMVRDTIFAASHDESRGNLQGVLFENDGDALNIVAIDGYRMAKRKAKSCAKISGGSIVIPAKILAKTLGIFSPEETDAISITFTEKKVYLSTDDVNVTLSLYDGGFVNYEDIVPKAKKTSIRCQTKALADMVERISIVTDTGRNDHVILNVDENGITGEARSEEGYVRDIIPAEVNGSDITIAFNAKYLTEPLKAIIDEEICIDFVDPVNPIVIRPTEGEKFLYLVLPVRMKGGADA